ncbi:MAG TPA: SAM-dependent methyltransferase [Lentisphaeria bacterium]|nr:MAG: hypothetical protein A2X48_12410 [Lentisphaerae bacterium GWF2_49_21]HBC87007.1 SAM-dependent methyltransferase [Lentisphaeria bacterium]
MNIEILTSQWSEHELLDSGNRRKLERFGNHVLVRSEPKAWWKPSLPESEWQKADAVNDDSGRWIIGNRNPSREWLMKYGKITFQSRLTDMSKHVGIFPEQSPHWDWMTKKIADSGRKDIKVLNLFGYTGAATLAAASCGAGVTHVDASKPSVSWARRNQELSKLETAPVRWIIDDAVKFVKREIRRNSKYDAIVMDPPSFGRGPDGEIWKAEDSISEFLDLCRQTLTDKPLFIILTMYNLEASSIMLGNIMKDTMKPHGGTVSVGELALKEKSSERVLPMSIFSRWINFSS